MEKEDPSSSVLILQYRFPPNHPIHAIPDPDTDSGSDCDLDEMIPSEAASIYYKEIDGHLYGLTRYDLGLLWQQELD